jgi:hypothetical protein
MKTSKDFSIVELPFAALGHKTGTVSPEKECAEISARDTAT